MLTKAPYQAISAEHLEKLGQQIYRKLGLYFDDKKNYFLKTRVAKRMAELGMDDPNDYIFMVSYADTSGLEMQALANLVTTNETYMFREYDQLQAFANYCLPEVLSAKQAKERVQFGKPIAEFGLIKQKVGQMLVDCYATEAVVSMVAGLTDGGYEDYAVEAAISKVFASEALGRTADEALQIAGGNGYMCEYPYERVVRDSRINRIFEGTNDILRLFIALNAMNDAGQNLRELAKSLEGVFTDPIKGFGVVSEYTLRRVSLATGYNRQGTTFTKLDPALKTVAAVFENGTRDLASASDRILRKHGRSIIDKQFATRRLADIMIDLFVLASVISRVDSSVRATGPDKAKKELEIATVFARQAERRIKTNVDEIDNNVDESIKLLADHAFEAEKFSWDTL